MAQAYKHGFRYTDRPMNNKLAEGWAKPRIRKLGIKWVCEVDGYLHHGPSVTIRGLHLDRDWAWATMVDHLVRHNIHATCPQP